MSRCLWLTRLVPYPPCYGGDFIYSAYLIEMLAAAGTQVTVLCHASGGGPPAVPDCGTDIEWVVMPSAARPAWLSLAGSNPSIAHRFSGAAVKRRLDELLANRTWDAVLIDHIGMGWALSRFQTRLAADSGRPALIYVSHNHEESVRRQVPAGYRGNPIKSLALRIDAAKVGPLERRLVDAADVVTVNTLEDEALFREHASAKAFLLLSPGYDGPQLPTRAITADLPRRATIVGSFGWLAKQMNLDAFLKAAASRFDRAGAEIEVLGMMPPDYARRVKARFPAVRVSGPIDDFAPCLAETRIGVVPDGIGGGFKHKALQYVFSRVPVAALAGSVAGTPLVPGESILEFPDLPSLADGVLKALDDLPLLDRLQRAAFDACAGQFEWADRGRRLATAIEEIATGRLAPKAVA